MDWRCQPFGNVRLCLRIKAAAAKRSPSQTFRYREKRRCVAAPKLAQSRRERENDWRPTKIYCLFSLLPYGLQALRVSSGNPPTDPVVVLVVATMGPISLSSSFSFFFPLSVCLFFKLFYSIYFFAFFLSSPLPSPQVLSSLSHTEREREREKKKIKKRSPFFALKREWRGSPVCRRPQRRDAPATDWWPSRKTRPTNHHHHHPTKLRTSSPSLFSLWTTNYTHHPVRTPQKKKVQMAFFYFETRKMVNVSLAMDKKKKKGLKETR